MQYVVPGFLEVPLVRLDPGLDLPVPARPGDAGVDLRARTEVKIEPAGGRGLVPTGVALELPPGRAGLVLPRSGLAWRHGVTCLNSPGLVDSGYRGEIMVILVNTDPREPFVVARGDRIAQLVVVDVASLQFREVAEVAELAASERGSGGLGHSGLG